MFTIRQARVADAAAMHELQQLAFAEEGRRSGTRDIPPLLEDLASIVQHIEHQIALVAARDETVVGCVRGVLGVHEFTIRGLIVHPSCQGQGIGSTLLKALEAAVPAPARIDLTTNTVMEGNVPFYERHGYRVTETTTPISGITLAHMSKFVAGAA
jgi:ribosomal protein S18 acetylase RimI-like enzyme